jgi:hypothetical protein
MRAPGVEGKVDLRPLPLILYRHGIVGARCLVGRSECVDPLFFARVWVVDLRCPLAPRPLENTAVLRVRRRPRHVRRQRTLK